MFPSIHTIHDPLWRYNVQILLRLFMREIGLVVQFPVLCYGCVLCNRVCSIHIEGYKFELITLITDPLAQWRVGNACVTVSIHRNTFKDGTLLSTWIRGGMNNPLSSLTDLLYNMLIVLLAVFLTTSHPIVIVSFMKEEESENGQRDGQ